MAGEYYYCIVKGQDDRPVNPNRARKSNGPETIFGTDLADTQVIIDHLMTLVEKVLTKMISRNECGYTLTLKL
jgi:DNA polymerase-4